MSRFFELCQRLIFGPNLGRWLLFLLLGPLAPAPAQSSPRPRAVPFGRRYRDARYDSLRRVPAHAIAPLRLQAARSRWPADSLGRLLGYVRLVEEFRALHRPDSAAHYLERAWRLAGARRRQQQPAVVIRLADDLAGLHYARGNCNGTLYYYQQATRQFRATGLDRTLAAEAAAMLQAASPPFVLREDHNSALLLTGLNLVPAQLAL